MISDEIIEEIKYKNDIESVVSSYVQVKRRGRNLVGLCPFHSEKTGSFTVYPDSQSFYCFGCGVGGDVVTFIRRIENLEYPEALKLLAERAGIKIEENFDDKTAKLKMRILEINRTAAAFYYKCLTSEIGKECLQYLTGRGLTPKIIRRFGLGYAPDSWNALLSELRNKGFDDKEIYESGVVSRSKSGRLYDAYRNKAMFPIIDLRGNIIGFGARRLSGDGPKYINSPDTIAFKKSRNLFALNFAKNDKSGNIILVEGYMDAISLHQAGFENTVATLGTALTSEQARIISQYAKSVVVSYDSDEAGIKAARRAIPLLDAAGLSVKTLRIQGAKDPDEFIKNYGAIRFKRMIDECGSAAEYELDVIKRKYDAKTNEGKVEILKESCVYISTIANRIERDVYAGKLSRELDVDKSAILGQVEELIKKRRSAENKKYMHDLKIYSYDNKRGGIGNPERVKNIKTAVAQEKLIACMLKYPEFSKKIVERLEPEDFSIEENRKIFSVAKDRIEKGLQFDFTSVNAELSMEDINRAAALVAGCEIKFTDNDIDYYINIVKDAANEISPEKAAELSDEEYLSRIKKIIDKKNNSEK